MRFACPSCKTRYRIDDGKLSGKVLQIRCKRCGVVIAVQGPQMAGGVSTVSIVEPPEPEKVWYAGINAKRVGPMTLGAMEQQIRYGRVQFTTLTWKSPMPQWIPAGDIPDLRRMLDQHMLSRMPSPPTPAPAEAEGTVEGPNRPAEKARAEIPDEPIPSPKGASPLGESDGPKTSPQQDVEATSETTDDALSDGSTAVDWRMPQSLEEAREVPARSTEDELPADLPDATTVDLLPTVVPQLLDGQAAKNVRPGGEPPKRRSVETPRVLPSVLVGTPASQGGGLRPEPEGTENAPSREPTRSPLVAGANKSQTASESVEFESPGTDSPVSLSVDGMSDPLSPSEELFADDLEPGFVPAESFTPETEAPEPAALEHDGVGDSVHEQASDAEPVLAPASPMVDAEDASPAVTAYPEVDADVARAPEETAFAAEVGAAWAPEAVAEIVSAVEEAADALEAEEDVPPVVQAPGPEAVAEIAPVVVAEIAPAPEEVAPAPEEAAVWTPEVAGTDLADSVPEVEDSGTPKDGAYVSLAEDLLEDAEVFSEPIDLLTREALDVGTNQSESVMESEAAEPIGKADDDLSAEPAVIPDFDSTSVDSLPVLQASPLDVEHGSEVETEARELQSNLAVAADSIDSSASQNDPLGDLDEQPVASFEGEFSEDNEEDEAPDAWTRTDLSQDESQDAYAAVETQKMQPYDRLIEEALQVNSSESKEQEQLQDLDEPSIENEPQQTAVEEETLEGEDQAENAVFVEEAAGGEVALPASDTGSKEVEQEGSFLENEASPSADETTPLSTVPTSSQPVMDNVDQTPADQPDVEVPASERITTTEKSVEMPPGGKGEATDNGFDDFDDFFNKVPQEFEDAAIEAEAQAEERPTRQDKKFLKEQMKEGHRTLIEVGGVKEPTAKEKEALRKEFEVVRKLEEENKKKKRNLFLAGIVTAFVVVCAVLYGSGNFSASTDNDYRSNAPRPDFGNQAPVPMKKKVVELEEPPADDAEEQETEPKVAEKTRVARKSDGKEKGKTVVRKRTIEEKAVEKFKTMTAEQLAAATREASGKSERLIDIAPSQLEVDRKKDLAAKKEREKASKSPRLQEIQKRLKSRKTKMLKCKNGTEETVEVRLKIGATGRLSSLNVSNGASEKKNCVAKELKKLVFPPGKSELSVKMRYIVP